MYAMLVYKIKLHLSLLDVSFSFSCLLHEYLPTHNVKRKNYINPCTGVKIFCNNASFEGVFVQLISNPKP